MQIDSLLIRVLTELLPDRSQEVVEWIAEVLVRLCRESTGQHRPLAITLIRDEIGARQTNDLLWRVFRAYRAAGGTMHDLSRLFPLLRPRELEAADRQDLFRYCLGAGLVRLLDLSSRDSFLELFELMRTEGSREAQEIFLGYLTFLLRDHDPRDHEAVYQWFVDAHQRLSNLDFVDPSLAHLLLRTSDTVPEADPFVVALLYGMLRPRLSRAETIRTAVPAAVAIVNGRRQQVQQRIGRLLSVDNVLAEIVRRFHRDERYHRLVPLIRLSRLGSESRQDLFRSLLMSPALRLIEIPSAEIFDDLISVFPQNAQTKIAIENIRPVFLRYMASRIDSYRGGNITFNELLDPPALWLPVYIETLGLVAPAVRPDDLAAWITVLSTISPLFFSRDLILSVFSLLPTVPDELLPALENLLSHLSDNRNLFAKVTPEDFRTAWWAVVGTDRTGIFLRILSENVSRENDLPPNIFVNDVTLYRETIRDIINTAPPGQARQSLQRQLSRIGHPQQKKARQ